MKFGEAKLACGKPLSEMTGNEILYSENVFGSGCREIRAWHIKPEAGQWMIVGDCIVSPCQYIYADLQRMKDESLSHWMLQGVISDEDKWEVIVRGAAYNGYTATLRGVRSISAIGDTVEHALNNLRDSMPARLAAISQRRADL